MLNMITDHRSRSITHTLRQARAASTRLDQVNGMLTALGGGGGGWTHAIRDGGGGVVLLGTNRLIEIFIKNYVINIETPGKG